MKAANLSRSVWNAIADLARRSQAPREIYFSEVTRVDAANDLVWANDFGDVAIPLVSFYYNFLYYDTVPTGNAHDGAPVTTQLQKRSDPTLKNEVFQAKPICPKKGDLVVILDPWGARRFPICIGLLRGKGAWKEG